MPSTSDPNSPVRADHRYLKKLIIAVLGGKVEASEDNFNIILKAFKKLDGSWNRLFLGSDTDIALLKTVIQLLTKKGILTKSKGVE